MRNINADIYHYDPRDYRSDVPGILSGFLLLSAILAALFVL